MIQRQIVPFLAAILYASSFLTQSSHAQTSSSVAGPWFGTIVLTRPDGKISHDNAVVVVEQGSDSLRGGMGRTIDQLTPWTAGTFKEARLTFHLDAAGGLEVLLHLHADRLSGTANGKDIKAQISLKAAPGLLPHQQLQQEITAADNQLYDSFGNCDVTRYANLLSRDLEFYQDHTGRTGYEENLQALRDRCSEGIKLRRELDPGSLVVNAVPGVGAIEAGTQRFYSRGEDGKEHLDATARFSNVWSKQSGTWKLLRVLSYDHR